MRFEDMVLKSYDVSRDYGLPTAEAQHAADMGYEVACPCGCHEAAERGGHAGTMIDAEPWDCGLCFGTGRVTIGVIIAADRARWMKA